MSTNSRAVVEEGVRFLSRYGKSWQQHANVIGVDRLHFEHQHEMFLMIFNAGGNFPMKHY